MVRTDIPRAFVQRTLNKSADRPTNLKYAHTGQTENSIVNPMFIFILKNTPAIAQHSRSPEGETPARTQHKHWPTCTQTHAESRDSALAC